MKQIALLTFIAVGTLFLKGCTSSNGKADGYGNFEATEVKVAAEGNGKLMAFEVAEGATLEKGALVGYIDTVALGLKRDQLLVQKEVIRSKSKGVLSQINVLGSQLKTAQVNKERIERLMEDQAATQKQLDDVNGEIEVIHNRIRSVEVQNAPVVNELKSIDVQLAQIADQIKKCWIVNPLQGTVLTKYVEPSEVVGFGTPLYKIADLTEMELRVYVSETQLAALSVGQKVVVKVDSGTDMKSYPGIISWIAPEGEFTPKIIQTKEERVTLVYAVKVKVSNDGSLKIGMPGEMWLSDAK